MHASAQSNHGHGIVEAVDARALSAGMHDLLVRLARRWNRLWGRTGPVFDGAYHARQFGSPRQVRNALAYVLQNGHKHGVVRAGEFDPCSSARWFDGWTMPGALPIRTCGPLAEPRTWLLREGWMEHGPLDPRETPRPTRW